MYDPYQWRDSRATCLCVLCAFALLCHWSRVLAQDFERYLPQPFAAPAYQPELPEPEEVKVSGSDAILVDRLDAVIVLDHASKVDADDPHAESAGIEFDVESPSSLVYSRGFRRIVENYLGGPVTLRRLNEMSRDIILYYRRCGQPVVDVVIPEQRITAGSVQIVVVESRVGRVVVRGGCYFDSCMLADQVCATRPGSRIYESALARDLYWLNRNPFRQVNVDLEPGQAEGTTDVVFQVRDWRPCQYYVGYEDTGVQPLLRERLLAGVIWGNACGRDGLMSYQYTPDAEFSHLNAHAASYQRDWNRCWSFLTYASWAGTTPEAAAPFNQDGESWQAAFRIKRYCCRNQWMQHGLRFGMDFKTSNTNLEFGGDQVFDSAADVWQFVVGYEYFRRWPDDTYFLLDYDFFLSPGQGFSEGHNAAAYNTIRANTDPEYFHQRARIERLCNLPNCWQAVGRCAAHAGSERLLYSEMLGLGGYDTVRGYDQRTLNADYGWVASVELGPRPYKFCSCQGRSQLRWYGFTDVGTAYTIDAIPGELDDTTLWSVGIGTRLALSNRLSLRLDLAEPLKHVPGLDTERTIHLGAVYRCGGPTY